MADAKISALPAATTPLGGTEVLPIVQSGTTDKVSVANLTAGRRIATAGMDASIGGSAHGVKITGITGGNQDFWALRNGSAVIQEGPNITLQSASGTTYASTIQMGPTGDTLFFMYNGSSWNQRFAMTAAGNLAVSTSGQGIDFSATPGTGTSELFSDYEEGTWTPTIRGSGTAGATGYSVQLGNYIKVGNQVTVWFRCIWTSQTGTGTTILTGLPYTINASVVTFEMLPIASQNVAYTAGNTLVAGWGATGVTYTGFDIGQVGALVGYSGLAIASTGDLMGSVTYTV